MEIDVRTRDLDWNETLQRQLERRVDCAVGRHRRRIGRILVCLADLNGPRGGVDKLCHITAAIRGAKRVVISETGSSLLAVIGRAARRLGYRIGRNIERRRHTSTPEQRATIREW